MVAVTTQLPEELTIFYDGDCPVCSSYTRFVELREEFGEVRLLNVRTDGRWVRFFEEIGLPLDDGFAVAFRGELLHGPEAMAFLANGGRSRGLFRKIHNSLLSRASIAKVTYPAMRVGRLLVLKLLGRERLRSDRCR